VFYLACIRAAPVGAPRNTVYAWRWVIGNIDTPACICGYPGVGSAKPRRRGTASEPGTAESHELRGRDPFVPSAPETDGRSKKRCRGASRTVVGRLVNAARPRLWLGTLALVSAAISSAVLLAGAAFAGSTARLGGPAADCQPFLDDRQENV
jgi:hypothetical protein